MAAIDSQPEKSHLRVHPSFVRFALIAFCGLLAVGACSDAKSRRRPQNDRATRSSERPLEVAAPAVSPRCQPTARRTTTTPRRPVARTQTQPPPVQRPVPQPSPPPERPVDPSPAREAFREVPPPDPFAAVNGLPTSRVYHVQPNDTLWSLAKQFYGDSKHWRRILAANRNRVPDPKALPVGIKLIIP